MVLQFHKIILLLVDIYLFSEIVSEIFIYGFLHKYNVMDMIRVKVKIGPKGQIVIPKIIRKSLGFAENQVVIMEVKKNLLQIKLAESKDIVNKWEKIAEKEGGNVSRNFIYGDKLYEEVF